MAFESPKRNRIFVSWGPPSEANKRPKSIEEQRDHRIRTLKKPWSMKQVSVLEANEIQTCGHKVLLTRLSASMSERFAARRPRNRTRTRSIPTARTNRSTPSSTAYPNLQRNTPNSPNCTMQRQRLRFAMGQRTTEPKKTGNDVKTSPLTASGSTA